MKMKRIMLCLLLGALFVLSSCTAKKFEETVKWDGEYDVIVVGFGGAGAAASISAADAGAKVLLLEKAPLGEEGGNTRYAAQIIVAPRAEDREANITYFKAMRGEYESLTDEMIDLIVDGSIENRAFIEKLGAEYTEFELTEYPELPGSEGMFTIVIDGELWTAKLWKLLRENVMKRSDNIEVWFDSPGMMLIQDPDSKIIHGVQVMADGKLLNIRAKNGVILATGGFENNMDMIQNFLQMSYSYSKGAKYNTGDGIKMAMRAGADLWHMATLSGPDVNFKAPELPIAFGYGIQNPSLWEPFFTGVTDRSVIMVGSDGTRFTDETAFPRHGHVNYHGSWISMPIPTPSYLILDEAARLNGPLYPSWTADSSAEIEKGWVIKANTIAELAEKIDVPAENLQNQIDYYNQYCADGYDQQYQRPSKYLKPITSGPYYALELSPSFTNTQGGPRRNVDCQIIDLDGNPIPHLYGAGELGSFYPDIYNGGGNLSECCSVMR